jgi:hypothetical protein
MLPTITTMSHLSNESVWAAGAERAGKNTTASMQRKTTQGLDGGTEARYSVTYTMGKAKR